LHGQSSESVYCLTGESIAAVHDSPFLEVPKKGFEVFLLVDPIDEHAITQLKEFDAKKVVCVSKEGLELRETEDTRRRQARRLRSTASFAQLSRMRSATRSVYIFYYSLLFDSGLAVCYSFFHFPLPVVLNLDLHPIILFVLCFQVSLVETRFTFLLFFALWFQIYYLLLHVKVCGK
jgi:Hsp90 protein